MTSAGPGRWSPRSLSGWPVARLRRGLHCHRHAAGSARGAAGHRQGMGPHGVRGPGKTLSLHPDGPQQHPPWELRSCPSTLASVLAGMEEGRAPEGSPLRPAISAEQPRFSHLDFPSPTASPFLAESLSPAATRALLGGSPIATYPVAHHQAHGSPDRSSEKG